MKIYTDAFLREKILEIQEITYDKLLLKKYQWYECFEIPKKDGTREICAFSDTDSARKVKSLQKNLLSRFFRKIPIAVCAKGFVKEESYNSFLEPHIGNRYFMRLDICNFFGSFSHDLIRQGLQEFVSDSVALERICELCTMDGNLPQGAVTSPALSNILFRRTDQRILKYCQMITERWVKTARRIQGESSDVIGREYGDVLCYTRYADDMLFSSDFLNFAEESYFAKMVSCILKENGFEINRSKTIVSEDKIVLNGYVVGESVWLSRRKLRDLKMILYFFKDNKRKEYRIDKGKVKSVCNSLQELNGFLQLNGCKKDKLNGIADLINYLAGSRSWLISVLRMRTADNKSRKRLNKLRERIEFLLLELNRQEDKKKGIG